MPMIRLPDPEPDFDSDEWHEDEYGSSKRPYDHSEGDVLGPCGCIDYHMADCDGSAAPTKNDYLDLYAGSYPDDWPDEGE